MARRLRGSKEIRWLAAGISAVLVAGVIGWALFVPGADWLARHDIGSATGTLLETARTNARGGLLTLAAGLAAAAALVFTARNSVLSRRTYELTEQGQVTERYTKAIEQLGSDKVDVRIGGIYALERVARDSSRDHPTVMEVLTAFIREHSREMWPVPNSDGEAAERSTRPDVQAAVDVVGRRDPGRDIRRVDLARAQLTGANLSGTDLTRADLGGADLACANLKGANLTAAYLVGANLAGANLEGANLEGANLFEADLREAILRSAKVGDAVLVTANLSGADLVLVNLVEATLGGADPRQGGADLTDAKFSNFYRVPDGWMLDTSRGPWSNPASGLGYLKRRAPLFLPGLTTDPP
jgi:Pentapeptide repeats (8 copies)